MTKIILPTYSAKVPSTGKTISYRPFTVKEEKALLLAIQENSVDTIAATIKNTIKICTDGVIDPDNHPYYDVEYLFLLIRSKSVGEYVDLVGSCGCTTPPTKTEFSIDVTTPVIEGNCLSAKLKIADTPYTIVLRHPSLSEFIESEKNPDSSGSDTIAACMLSVYTDEEVFDWDLNKKIEFVDSMAPKQQKEIIKFFDAMPTIKLDASFDCKKCNTHHDQFLSGFQNFFV